MLTVRQVLEWMYPLNMNLQDLDWKRRAIWDGLWSRLGWPDFTVALNLLHPMECDASRLRGRERELYEARRYEQRRQESASRSSYSPYQKAA